MDENGIGDWALVVVLYGVIPYAVTSAPGFALLRYLRQRAQTKPQSLPVGAAAAATLMVSPSFIFAAHHPLIVPFGLSLFVERNFTPSPIWNTIVAAATFAITWALFRRRQDAL